ncbi:MAG: dephospho-CoA kinase [Anaerovoracaceae bacterium]|jgi:dephospho-CoA kinase
MKLIGLTGGIGSGKSTVSEYLISKGCYVLDADEISREIVKPGSPVLERIAKTFGKDVIMADGNLDRKKVSSLVFSDKGKRKALDSIMHGEIIDIILDRAGKIFRDSPDAIVFIDAPLLFEAGVDQHTQQNWVVDTDDEIRISRVMRRSGFSREEVERRIANQMARKERLSRATHVLDNSGSKESLFAQIDRLLEGII